MKTPAYAPYDIIEDGDVRAPLDPPRDSATAMAEGAAMTRVEQACEVSSAPAVSEHDGAVARAGASDAASALSYRVVSGPAESNRHWTRRELACFSAGVSAALLVAALIAFA